MASTCITIMIIPVKATMVQRAYHFTCLSTYLTPREWLRSRTPPLEVKGCTESLPSCCRISCCMDLTSSRDPGTSFFGRRIHLLPMKRSGRKHVYFFINSYILKFRRREIKLLDFKLNVYNLPSTRLTAYPRGAWHQTSPRV